MTEWPGKADMLSFQITFDLCDNISAFPGHSVIFSGNMSGFLKTVWKNLSRALSGRFFLARNYLQSPRYKN